MLGTHGLRFSAALFSGRLEPALDDSGGNASLLPTLLYCFGKNLSMTLSVFDRVNVETRTIRTKEAINPGYIS
jgi:hypothetical protein